jgi:hypothetical protein
MFRRRTVRVGLRRRRERHRLTWVGYLAVAAAPPPVVITVVDPPAPPPGLTQEQLATLLARIDALELAIRTRSDENTDRILAGQRISATRYSTASESTRELPEPLRDRQAMTPALVLALLFADVE